MKKQSHPNFMKSSNLLFVTVILVLIGVFLGKVVLSADKNSIYIEMMNIILIGGLGLLVRQGYKWVKYLPLTLSILYLIEAAAVVLNSPTIQISQVLFFAQIVLVIWSTVLLFRIPKETANLSIV
ncbi:MAG: hypothetical protein JZU47_02945 [Prolixibacteraceae bacterium]|nr:hypothetical protein [Prolixibacteraceae bacterium]